MCAEKIALVLLGLFALSVRSANAIEVTEAELEAGARENAAIAAEYHKLERARAAVLAYPETDDRRKRHVAMLQKLYERAKKLEFESHYGAFEPRASIYTELNRFGIEIPNEFRWQINDKETVKPKVLLDPKTRISYHLASDGRHISAIDRYGKILWRRDPFNDAGLWPYRFSKPVIVYFEFGTDRQDKQGILLRFNSSQFGYLDMATGAYRYGGQD
jgi:hypothetical protein